MRIKRSLSAIIATIFIAAVPLAASAQVSVGIGLGFNIGTPPPPIPSYYSVPPAPYPNYQWQPGYWSWGPAGYYWVPGTWVAPPSVGMYWTPGYWGAGINGGYAWNAGYWGPQVGFYGGINYGYGYYGTGFVGGYWSGGAFNYNTAVLPVNRTVIHNVYINKTVINKGRVCGGNCRASFNGPHGGINARPTHGELAARDRGVRETSAQRQHEREAAQDRALYARANSGHPPVTAVQKPISDAKSLPHYEAVRDGDRQAAQAEVRHGTTQSAPQHNAVESAPQHNVTQSHPHNNQPPQSTHANTQMHASTHSSGNSMRGNGGMYGAHEGGSRSSRGSVQGHSGGNGPSGGNEKSKPPRR
ncbi:MAG TPA: YXWGXW repeat-containing protein [Candidatus Cybelea sp.]|jgi:hypothetical protein